MWVKTEKRTMIPINTPPYTTIDKNFPRMMDEFLIGEEYNNLMEPLAYSLLMRPIVTSGIYK